jgi:two-component system nitrate/nitrite response regulator NarL
MLKILLIDDHPLVMQGISSIIQCHDEFEIVASASCCQEGLRLLTELKPDIALVDLHFPGEYGLDIIKEGRSAVPQCRFIILSSSGNYTDIKRAMNEKVEGYILKEALPEEIINAIKLVAKGRSYIDPSIMQTLVNNSRDPMEELTARELEVLSEVASGRSNRDIADKLYVTEYTVKKHMSQILYKLNLSDRTQAALYAFSRGMGMTDPDRENLSYMVPKYTE